MSRSARVGSNLVMTGYNYKPSKPAAVLSVLIGAGMLIFAITAFDTSKGSTTGFLIFWCVALVAIVGMNVWAAFSPNGSLAVLSRRKPPGDTANNQ
ncbi:MAG: hypothetical protein JWL79_2597 [Frankiales bacterium]|nr:hypothetical protein [Frankiales bacterium]